MATIYIIYKNTNFYYYYYNLKPNETIYKHFQFSSGISKSLWEPLWNTKFKNLASKWSELNFKNTNAIDFIANRLHTVTSTGYRVRLGLGCAVIFLCSVYLNNLIKSMTKTKNLYTLQNVLNVLLKYLKKSICF